ncbi:MAG: IS1380 family transposase [Bacteroidales bacterium]|nr:IS1380 family transposase [Bacteroidales bacterium]
MDKNTHFSATKPSRSALSPTLFNLSDFDKKNVELRFSAKQTSHDGGLLLLREVEQQIGLIGRLAGCLKDNRHQSYVKHNVTSMLTQRIFQIAAGYEDANDCDSMKDDGILKLCSGGHQALSSQPTMCRFENAPDTPELFTMAKVFVDSFIASYPAPPDVIILDCDDTDAVTYGHQQLSLFNSYYGDHCYMPLHIYEGLSGKLIASVLKPGRRSKGADFSSLVRRIITYLMKHWPNTIIIHRGDAHFCSKAFMDWSEAINNVDFITGLAGNEKLNKIMRSHKQTAQRRFAERGKPVKVYHSFFYQAGSWRHPQRVVAKVEVTAKGTNVRFITSSLRNVKTKELYEKGYCARGAAELRIKDHKTYLASDRMSCTSFKANQFRLLLHSAAYVLIHTLQQEVLRGTAYKTATMKTIQLKLIKVAARVTVLKTKVKIELPAAFATRWVFEKCFGLFQPLRI